MILFLTALAGGAGGAARFTVDTAVNRRNKLTTPMGTQVINVTACFLLGLLAGYTGAHLGNDSLSSVLGVGLMGGYSTFSTASVESARLLITGRWRAGIVHALTMVVVSYLAAIAGLFAGGLL